MSRFPVSFSNQRFCVRRHLRFDFKIKKKKKKVRMRWIRVHTYMRMMDKKKKGKKKEKKILHCKYGENTDQKKKKAKGESVGRSLYARNKCIEKILQLLATVHTYMYINLLLPNQKKTKNCFYGSRCCSRQAPATAAPRFHVRCIISTPSLRPSLSTF